MRRTGLYFLLVLFALGVWSCNANAVTESTETTVSTLAAPDEEVAEAIIQLEREWVAAILNKDAAALERLLADDFNGTSASAHTFPKAFVIEDLKSGAYDVERMDIDELTVNVYGDAAVAFSSQEEKSSYAGVDTSGHYHFTNVWVKRNGIWQAVASHGSRFNEAH